MITSPENLQRKAAKMATLVVLGVGLVTLMATSEEDLPKVEEVLGIPANNTVKFTLGEGETTRQIKLSLKAEYTQYGVAVMVTNGRVSKDAAVAGDLEASDWRRTLLEYPQLSQSYGIEFSDDGNSMELNLSHDDFCGENPPQNSPETCIPGCIRGEPCVLTLELKRTVTAGDAADPLPEVTVEFTILLLSEDKVQPTEELAEGETYVDVEVLP
jgi:hypothetical protein